MTQLHAQGDPTQVRIDAEVVGWLFGVLTDGTLTPITTEAALREALTRPVPFLALPGEVPE